MPQLLIKPRLTNYFTSIMQFVRSLSLNITGIAALSLLCALLSCTSNTNAPRVSILRVKVDQQLTDIENLKRFAKAEKNAIRLSPVIAPPPPGVNPQILARKTQAEPQALLSLDLALKDVISKNEVKTIAPPVLDEIDSQVQAMALRHYLKGRDAALQNKHLYALNEFRNSLEIDPYNPSALLAAGRSFLATGRRQQALASYEKLLELEPDNSEATFEVGISAALRQQHSQAIEKLARPYLSGKSFEHDPGADFIANYILQESFRKLGYDRASIQIAHEVIDKPYQSAKPTVHIKRIESIYIQRPEIWRKIGDAHCRLGEYAQALRAYEEAASLPLSDPAPISTRIIYANLMLGRTYSAQLKLLSDMQTDQARIGESTVLLCRYIARHVSNTKLLGHAIAGLYQENLDDPQTARAAASLMSPRNAVMLLRQFLERCPEDLKVVSQLYEWLLKDDPHIALELTARMCQDRPHYAKDYCKRLAVASTNIADLLSNINKMPASASASLIKAQLLFHIDGIGGAWDACVDALQQWPNDLPLLLLQLDIASYVKEPQLFDQVSESLNQYNDVATWIARASASRAINDTQAAINASDQALLLDKQNVEALTEHARCLAQHALVASNSHMRSDFAHKAITAINLAITHNDKYEDAFAALFEIYDQAGPFPSPQLHDETALRLRRALPDSTVLKRIKAQRSGRMGLLEQSVEQFLSLYENDPNDALSLDLAITSWSRQGNNLAAQQWIDKRLQLKPDDPNLLKQWARLQIQERRSDVVIQKMQGIIDTQQYSFVALDILASTYRILGKTSKFVDIARARVLERPIGIRREIELVVLLIQAKRFDEAKQRLNWIFDTRDNAEHNQLLSAVTIAGEIPGADNLVLDYSNYIFDRFSSTPMIVYGYALRALAKLGQIDKNFDTWADRAATDARGFDYDAAIYVRQWQQLMQLLIDAEQTIAASRAIRAPFRIEKQLSTVEIERLLEAAIVADASANRSDATIEIIRDLSIEGLLPIVIANPAASELDILTETFFQAAQIYSMLGHDAGAVNILKQAVLINPQYALAHNNLGYARLELGATDNAVVTTIEKAFELAPDDPNIIDTIGWLRYKEGRFDDVDGAQGAVTLLERAMRLDSDTSEVVLEHVGDARWRNGDKSGALQAWQNAVRLLKNPGHRQQWIGAYNRLQSDPERGWGLVVVDPRVLYQNNFGIVLERISAKLEAVKQEKQPETAPTFAEQNTGIISGDTQDGRP